MGQRSQIYIRYRNRQGIQLIARYFHWNFGERMVSRTRGIIEWLYDHQEYFGWLFDNQSHMLTLERIADVNFDMRDVVVSSCIKEEIRKLFPDADGDKLTACLFGQDNNDGQLLIDVSERKIKYAFIPYYTERKSVMGAAAYMEWNNGKTWRARLKKEELSYTMQNIQFISDHAKLMTAAEVDEFLSYDYSGAVFGYPF